MEFKVLLLILLFETLTVNIDEDEIGYAEIKATVDKAGYKLVKQENRQKERKS